MAEGKRGAGWVAAVAGLLAVALGVWVLGRGGPSGPPEGGETPGTAGAPAGSPPADAGTPPLQAVESSQPRIPSHGRIRLSEDSLPDDAPLSLVLEVEEEARGAAAAPTRIVSMDGRVMDLTAQPEPDAGLRLDVDPAFLEPGLYMIQVETEEHHPLQIRRWVLEIE